MLWLWTMDHDGTDYAGLAGSMTEVWAMSAAIIRDKIARGHEDPRYGLPRFYEDGQEDLGDEELVERTAGSWRHEKMKKGQAFDMSYGNMVIDV